MTNWLISKLYLVVMETDKIRDKGRCGFVGQKLETSSQFSTSSSILKLKTFSCFILWHKNPSVILLMFYSFMLLHVLIANKWLNETTEVHQTSKLIYSLVHFKSHVVFIIANYSSSNFQGKSFFFFLIKTEEMSEAYRNGDAEGMQPWFNLFSLRLAFYFCWLCLGFRSRLHLWRSSWWTKHVRIINFCWSQNLFSAII